jgi:hypothetical protein
VFQDAAEADPRRDPDVKQAAGRVRVGQRLGPGLADLCQRPIHRPDDVGQGDLIGGAAELVAALGAPVALHDAGVLELRPDVLRELGRELLGLRDLSALQPSWAGRGQFRRGLDRVVHLGWHSHGRIWPTIVDLGTGVLVLLSPSAVRAP